MSNLSEIRKASGITQQALADKTGIHWRTIQKLESGERDINKLALESAVKMADALNVDVRRLLEKKGGTGFKPVPLFRISH